MEKEVQRDRGGQEIQHSGNVYSGGERLGIALEILADSMRVFHVARYEKHYWTHRIRERD